MDSSLATFKHETPLQNPNPKLHSTTSKKSFKRQCILRGRVIKRQNKLLSKLERDFQSLLSFSPTIDTDPKSARNLDPGLEVQRRSSINCHEFLRNELYEGEGGEEESLEFFKGLFEKDDILKGVYVNDSAMGMFVCLVCGWSGEKIRKIYGSCIGLVQHACTVEKTEKIGAHRAFGRVVCDVLGWDVNDYSNIRNSKVGDKLRKLKKKNVSLVCFRNNELDPDSATRCYNPCAPYQQVMATHRSSNGMDLDENDFQVDINNRDDIVEKVEELNFNSTFTGAECNAFQSSSSFARLSDGRNNCSVNFKSTNTLLQITCTGRAKTSSYFRTSGPTIGQCIEKLKNLHGVSPGSKLFSFACNLMRSNVNREIFMELGDDMTRYTWLEYNYDEDGQKKS